MSLDWGNIFLKHVAEKIFENDLEYLNCIFFFSLTIIVVCFLSSVLNVLNASWRTSPMDHIPADIINGNLLPFLSIKERFIFRSLCSGTKSAVMFPFVVTQKFLLDEKEAVTHMIETREPLDMLRRDNCVLPEKGVREKFGLRKHPKLKFNTTLVMTKLGMSVSY